jgi:hypothetical protein
MLPQVKGSFSLLLSFHAELQYATNDRPIFISCSEIHVATTRTCPCMMLLVHVDLFVHFLLIVTLKYFVFAGCLSV